MKNKMGVSEIARQLNLSKATVSKALANKPGVSEKTKKDILKYALSVGFSDKDTKDIDVSFVLPEKYKAVYSDILKKCKEEKISAECMMYLSEEDYLKVLKGLLKKKSKLFVICPLQTSESINIIKRLGDVWFVGDMLNIENTFYFGKNPIKDGCSLAEEFIKSEKKKPLFITRYKSVINARRAEVFAFCLAKCGIYPVKHMIFDEKTELSAPFLARKIAPIALKTDSVFCADESSSVVLSALKKLKREDIKVFSFEDSKDAEISIEKLVKSIKDFKNYGEYPLSKYNFI